MASNVKKSTATDAAAKKKAAEDAAKKKAAEDAKKKSGGKDPSVLNRDDSGKDKPDKDKPDKPDKPAKEDPPPATEAKPDKLAKPAKENTRVRTGTNGRVQASGANGATLVTDAQAKLKAEEQRNQLEREKLAQQEREGAANREHQARLERERIASAEKLAVLNSESKSSPSFSETWAQGTLYPNGKGDFKFRSSHRGGGARSSSRGSLEVRRSLTSRAGITLMWGVLDGIV